MIGERLTEVVSKKGPKDLRKTLDGIRWILCTGSMWNQLPSR